MSVFELSVDRAAGSGSYGVQVVRSPAGEAAAEFDVDVEAMLAQRGPIQAALLASSAATRGRLTLVEKPVRDLGTDLFAALFSSPGVAGRYQASLAMARDRGEALRVVLRVNAPELAALPWEAMFDAEAGGYLCRSEPLVRRVPVPGALTPLSVHAPLRILGIVSAPRGLVALDVDREREQLESALRTPIGAGTVELRWAPAATWETIQELLLTEQWHVVHFIGHGDFDVDDAEGVLALVGHDGRVNHVSAGSFADLLREARPTPRLVVLNSCASATSGVHDLFSGTAASLVRSGIRAVAAMQFSVTDRAAIAFSRAFYIALAHGRGVDEAVHSGRVGILGTGGHTLEWVTPVLYLRGDNAHLFSVTTPTPAATPEPDPAPIPAPPAAREEPVHTDPPSLVCLRTIEVATAGWWKRNLVLAGGSVPFSPDGRLLASAYGDKTLQLWDPATGQRVGHPLTGHTARVWPAAFSPDGRLLASGSDDKTIRLWDPATGQPAGEPFSGHTDWVRSVAFSPDGRLLASASDDKTIRLWDPATGRPVGQPLKGHSGRVWPAAFSPDGRLLASAGADRTVRLWDPANGQPIGQPFSGHTDWVRSIAFSPDGRLLASASDDMTIRLWDPANGQPVGEPLTGHTGWVWAVAFSPDGRLLVSAGDDKTIRLWDPTTGRSAGQPLIDHLHQVRSLAFSPDGRLLASLDVANTVRIWGETKEPR
ncbi:CHAT domain-containing protein [Actinoplanes sp. NPDC049668]|uniref:CHAT domain-containing WD40 repeat protein n=1 Tax=unclassified Actinoplanes TaxID=2626549 RepID=UPI0033A0BB31